LVCFLAPWLSPQLCSSAFSENSVVQKNNCLRPQAAPTLRELMNLPVRRFVTLAWEGPLAGVWRAIDRKFRRRPRGRNILLSISGCIVCVSCDSAEVNRLEMLFSMGCRRERGVCPIRECAVPARLRLSACATSGPAHRARSIAVPSVAHVCERFGSVQRDHSLTHQRPLGIFDLCELRGSVRDNSFSGWPLSVL
jgi:hypothetical protein